MSLLSPESLSVFIAPGELQAIRWRGIRRQIVEKRLCPVTLSPDNLWAGAARAFADLLDEFPACRRVSVVLSGHFAQYQLMPYREDLGDSDEELAVARLGFGQTYGDAATGWQVRLGDEPPGATKVAAAVDAELLAALESAASSRKVRLVSIQPSLVAAVNYWHDSFQRDGSSWLVLHEEGRICFALAERGQWRWIRNLRSGADWPESLTALLDNEALLAGVDDLPAQALVFSPETPELTVPAASRWSFRSLQPETIGNFSPASDSRFAFALLG